MARCYVPPVAKPPKKASKVFDVMACIATQGQETTHDAETYCHVYLSMRFTCNLRPRWPADLRSRSC